VVGLEGAEGCAPSGAECGTCGLDVGEGGIPVDVGLAGTLGGVSICGNGGGKTDEEVEVGTVEKED